MPRVQSKQLVGGQGQGRLMQAALSQQIGSAAQSSSRIREAAEQQTIQAKAEGNAALGAGLARGITTAAGVTQRERDRQLQRDLADDEIYQQHLDRVSRERMATDMETSANRRYLAGIAADKAASALDHNRAMELQDERLIAAAESSYYNRTTNIETFLLGQSFEEDALDRQIKLGERFADVIDRTIKHEEESVEPVLKLDKTTTDDIETYIDEDSFKAGEDGVSIGGKRLTEDLQRQGINEQTFPLDDTAALIARVQDGTISSKELQGLRGVLPAWKKHLQGQRTSAKAAGKVKEKKSIVGRRLPFEGPLSDEEIRRRIEAGEKDPWYERVGAISSGFLQKYELEVPSDPEAAGRLAEIDKQLERIEKLERAFEVLSTSEAARAAKIIGPDGEETGQTVAEMVSQVGKPLDGESFGVFMARNRDLFGTDKGDLTRGIIGEWIKGQQMVGLPGLPDRLKEKARKQIMDSETFKTQEEKLQFLYKKWGISDKTEAQGRVDPRAYEAAGGVK